MLRPALPDGRGRRDGLFCRVLKRRASPDVAAVKAKEAYAKGKEAFRKLDAMLREGALIGDL